MTPRSERKYVSTIIRPLVKSWIWECVFLPKAEQVIAPVMPDITSKFVLQVGTARIMFIERVLASIGL